MGRLTKTELAVGELYYRQGLRPREIAQRLGISINTVYKALSKYRSYMRDNISGKGVGSGEQAPIMTEVRGNTQGTGLLSLSFTINVAQPIPIGGDGLTEISDALNSLSREIKLLKDEYSQLMNVLMELKKLITSIKPIECSDSLSEQRIDNNMNLPSFVRDNVWVDIIRSRENGKSMVMSAKSS